MGASEYIRRLRDAIGHDPLLLPSVTLFIFDDRGRLLLVRDRQLGLWAPVGGCIEPGESPEEAAIRETREETGLEIELLGLRGVIGGPHCRMVYANGDVVDYVMIGYFARVTGGEVRPCQDEVAEVRFVEEGELAGLHLAPWAGQALHSVFAEWRGRKKG